LADGLMLAFQHPAMSDLDGVLPKRLASIIIGLTSVNTEEKQTESAQRPEPGHCTSRGGCSRKASGHEAVLTEKFSCNVRAKQTHFGAVWLWRHRPLLS